MHQDLSNLIWKLVHLAGGLPNFEVAVLSNKETLCFDITISAVCSNERRLICLVEVKDILNPTLDEFSQIIIAIHNLRYEIKHRQ